MMGRLGGRSRLLAWGIGEGTFWLLLPDLLLPRESPEEKRAEAFLESWPGFSQSFSALLYWREPVMELPLDYLLAEGKEQEEEKQEVTQEQDKEKKETVDDDDSLEALDSQLEALGTDDPKEQEVQDGKQEEKQEAVVPGSVRGEGRWQEALEGDSSWDSSSSQVGVPVCD